MNNNYWDKLIVFIKENNFNIISAFLYACGYAFCQFFSFSVLLSFFILFYSSLPKKNNILKPSFLQGFVWGVIVFSVISYPILCLFYQIGSEGYRFLCWLFLVVYLSLYSGIWFKINNFFSQYLNSSIYILLIWILSSFLFIKWVEGGILFIFGNFEGLSILNPLVPLIKYKFISTLVVSLGKDLTLLFIFFFLSLFAWIFYYNFNLGLLVSFFFLGFIFKIIISVHEMPSRNLFEQFKVGFVSWDAKKEKKIWPTARQISEIINKLLENNQDIKIIIFPESTFPFCLNKYPEVVKFWYSNMKNEIKPEIIMGSHRYENNKIYNTCYWLANGQIKDFYDKHHGLFFAERLPFWAKELKIRNLLLLNAKPVSQQQEQYKIFKLNNLNFFPLICSDLFFEKEIFAYKKDYIFLAIINDAWCNNNFFSEILFRSARLSMCNSKNNILYISHTKSFFIDFKGECKKIGSS